MSLLERRFVPHVVICAAVFAAWGTILWNGAGLATPDDGVVFRIAQAAGPRLLLTASYVANHALGQWMATNLAIHLGTALLVYRFTGNLGASVLFSVHPLAGDAIASIAGRSSLLCGLYVVATLVACKEGKFWRAGLLGLLAFAAKEEAVALFLLVPLVLAWKHKQYLRPALSLIGVAGILFLTMKIPLLIQAGSARPILEQGIASAEPVEHAGRVLSAVGCYVVPRLFIPVRFSADPELPYTKLCAAAGIAGSIVALPLVPYALAPLPDVLFEHRAYMAIPIAMWLLAAALGRKKVALAMVAVWFSVASIQRADLYARPLSLAEEAAAQATHSGRPHVNYGAMLGAAGRLQAAHAELTRATQIQPSLKMAWEDLAYVNIHLGDVQGATFAMNHLPDKRKQKR